ncbi:O-antigen ligase family protein [Yersinia mollaretii]|uniref:O-antigen ligase family protein n=1 Tax=Yersinia mollaretii TaxID=33060 RepID=UPI0005DBEEC8|nr:O-antigen ligase [Yersinia mollaretii]MDA5525258.1 O-antigen ligase [Yersinia mollaretii]MDR7872649.1 O-antigen ligase [Yersinia mollaretii]PHZ33375.1 O-antigen biosynthesis protein [Yersinia mollaretii]WQC75789.1 O-antigen ligase [Yersinia mollaretii]CNE39137.1 putative O-antigen biosynthesis protein [Yersinia mollaretii]
MTTLSPAHPVNHRSEMLSRFAALLLGIGLATNNQLMNISLVLIVISLIINRKKLDIKSFLTSPLVYLPAVMFALLALSLLYQHNSYGPDMVGKYKKLLYVLPLALFFVHQPQLIKRFCAGFLVANAVILAGTLMVGVLHIPLSGVEPTNPTIFKLQITQNFFMALAALLWLALAFNSQGWKRWGYGLLVVAASYSILFLILGRTGYVALVVGLGVWLFFSLGNRQRLALVVLGIVAFTALVFIPNKATDRIVQGVNEIKVCVAAPSGDAYEACSSSMGQRSAFAIEASRLIKEAPILGHGAGGFYYGNPETGYSINNPHNEYLIETIHSGVIGLLIFLAWIVCCYRVIWQQTPLLRNVLLAVLTSYMACNFFNSFLLDSSEGHLFMIFVAILAGYSVAGSQPVSDKRLTE